LARRGSCDPGAVVSARRRHVPPCRNGSSRSASGRRQRLNKREECYPSRIHPKQASNTACGTAMVATGGQPTPHHNPRAAGPRSSPFRTALHSGQRIGLPHPRTGTPARPAHPCSGPLHPRYSPHAVIPGGLRSRPGETRLSFCNHPTSGSPSSPAKRGRGTVRSTVEGAQHPRRFRGSIRTLRPLHHAARGPPPP